MTPPDSAATVRTRRPRYAVLLGAALLLAGGGFGAWWWSRPAPIEPPLPAEMPDAEIRHAIEEARQAVVQAPRSATAWGHLGLVLLANAYEPDAEPCFTQAARFDLADPRWPYASGLIAWRRDHDQAVLLYRQALATVGSRPEYRTAMQFKLAEALLQRGNLDEAEKLFKEQGHEEPRAALGLGQTAWARGNADLATKFLTVAHANRCACKRATAQLAALARARGDLAAAESFEKKCAQLPDDAAWPDLFAEELGRLQVGRRHRERQIAQLEKHQRYAEAAELYLQEIADQPTRQAYIGAATNLARVGDFQRALALLHKALLLDPESANTRTALAVTLFNRAEKEWQKSPNSPQAKEWFRDVAAHAQRAAELRPDHGYAYLYWGLALRFLAQPEKAVPPLRKAVVCQPTELTFHLGLAEALLEAGQQHEAATCLENARLLDPNDPRLARVLERLHRKN
jgi:tetratricopeptide (TPR) repeat protein